MKPVIIALDYSDLNQALSLAKQLSPDDCRLKVGKELFTNFGPQVVELLHQLGFDVFLDLKFHDIPNTTAQAVVSAAKMGVWMVNIHAMAGRRALTECADRLQKYQLKTKLIAVTVLTSMNAEQMSELNISLPMDEQVISLAKLSQDCGLDGVVCSAQEARLIKRACGNDFELITPGIRMTGDNPNDQSRICTPKQAIEQGSDYLVVGRSVTQAKNPSKALELIIASI